MPQRHDGTGVGERRLRRDRGLGWFRSCLLALAVVASVRPVPALAQSSPPSEAFTAELDALHDASYVDKEQIVDRLAASGYPSARAVLAALLDDRLYVRQSDRRVVIVAAADDAVPEWAIVDPLTRNPMGVAPHDGLDKIGTNNHLRKVLRTALARFDLSSPDASARLAAVDQMLRDFDDSNAALLRSRAALETNTRVKKAIDTGLALSALDSQDRNDRLRAIGTLSGSLRADVRNRLAAMLEPAADGSPVEPDAAVRGAAAGAVRRIDRVRALYAGVETLFFGLSVGSVLVLVATGLAITFGVMGVINMAHGEFMMLGAYTTYVVQQAMPDHIGLSILVAIPAAFIVSALAGVLLERSIIRVLYGRPLETLLATFGVSLVLQQLVRSIFSANNRSVDTPSWMSGTLQINDALSITLNHLVILIFALLVFVALGFVLKRTRLGLDIRAVSQNRAMAQAMGIRTWRVDALAFGLGSGIAGMAGVALSQFTNVGPNLGQSYILDSFMVVVFGGVGNLGGTLVGGMAMGVANQLLEPQVGAVLAKIVVLVALIVFIQRWPRGLFPQSGRAAETP